ncbi:MAG: hypothetical protein CSA42_03210 [Gammaproteobacteria bacterium]|nr:MAG: hypothetical protein CSA42_03210 [Gammaproteobacteria bacterium]
MKKLILIPAFAMALTACATGNNADPNATINTGYNLGKTAFRIAVNNKCQTELNKNKIWNIAKKGLTTTKQNQIQSNVCGCVSQKASEEVTIDQLTMAAIDTNARGVLVADMVTHSLNKCYKEFVK